VDAFLPVQITRVAESDRESVISHSSFESALTGHQEMPEPDDKVISECLRILNSKLDNIIQMLASQKKEYERLPLRQINISAGGLRTCVESRLALKDFVEVRMMLPTAPFMVFYVYGVVVKVEQTTANCRISVEFTEIDDDIREQIVKYVFERQREILRKKRRQ
jgi:c-di-GMP-binding flagellar brake protein YcgR